MRFLEDMTAAILSNNRLHAPFGLSAASRAPWAATMSSGPTARCSRWVAGQRQLRPGDVFVVETPGGGGYGAL